jgi:hypothetical protein
MQRTGFATFRDISDEAKLVDSIRLVVLWSTVPLLLSTVMGTFAIELNDTHSPAVVDPINQVDADFLFAVFISTVSAEKISDAADYWLIYGRGEYCF